MGSYSALQAMVSQASYKPGWQFRLHHGCTSASDTCAQTDISPPRPVSAGGYGMAVYGPLFLVICASVQDSSGRGMARIEHRFTVPPEEYAGSWERWLLERILDVERHETCEWLTIAGRRPFYPEHGPDARLYAIIEHEPSWSRTG